MARPTQSRRAFFQKTSIAAALPLLTVLPQSAKGANDRLQIGAIGCGSRGRNALMTEIHQFSADQNVAITAVCDVWNQHRESAASMTEEWFGKRAQEFVDYRDVLALSDIDAVTIATPDHLHATILYDAVKAGKDAYCEKPLARNLKELHRVVDAVKQSDRVVQLGTQLRSYPSFTGCRKAVHDQTLGKIIKVAQTRNYYEPYWYGFKRDIKESDTHWEQFLGHVKHRDFNDDQHSVWYGYRDFTDGSISNLMCHFIDLVHYITGAQFPSCAVTLCGNYAWEDQRTCPDSVHTLLEYPEGFMVSYSTSCGNGNGNYTKFWGTKGMIDATDWREPFMTGDGTNAEGRIEKKQRVPDVDIAPHMLNWLQCLRNREQPNADINAGYQHAIACLLADAAYLKERKMTYDPKKRKFKSA
ncbi:MAG: Gfo/Idh/MocA family oxidoreductase [Candidatus Hinthialibacter antarcticus]|nr:Gfo/Idh/MocA family oxidoreductase [Candidatus Hinthialibacter antarcticus]